MRILSHRVVVIPGLSAALATALVVALFGVSRPSPAAAPPTPAPAASPPAADQPAILRSVDAASLASSGIHLYVPLSTAAPVSRDAAIDAGVWPGASLREAALVELDSDFRANHKRLVWAVSQVPLGGIRWPSGGPMGHKAHQYNEPTYFLTFIDAETGAFVFAIIG